jgi:hypothetical protein
MKLRGNLGENKGIQEKYKTINMTITFLTLVKIDRLL